jgi:hypothetical protein
MIFLKLKGTTQTRASGLQKNASGIAPRTRTPLDWATQLTPILGRTLGFLAGYRPSIASRQLSWLSTRWDASSTVVALLASRPHYSSIIGNKDKYIIIIRSRSHHAPSINQCTKSPPKDKVADIMVVDRAHQHMMVGDGTTFLSMQPLVQPLTKKQPKRQGKQERTEGGKHGKVQEFPVSA